VTRGLVIGAVLVALAWLGLGAFAWFDPLAACRIVISVDLLDGDRGAIRDAVALVRREDPAAYAALCRTIDRIDEERVCLNGDPSADPGIRGAGREDAMSDFRRAEAAPGCYMRGSRTIILRRARDGEAGPAFLRARADALKRLANASRSFWLERGR
jgi:hypothetical protein